MSDEIVYMDEWLRGHGRSVPMARNGVSLQWQHTHPLFDEVEIKSMYAAGIVEHRTFTAQEKAALDAYTSPQWPYR
jgi:hypothetical protein